MNILAFLIAIYALVMILLHVFTGKILKTWREQPGSRISRWCPPRLALRTEGLFWLLALAAWFLWASLALKVLVVVFAAIHLGIWGASELKGNSNMVSAFNTTPATRRAIVVFDLIEALVLTALSVLAVLYLIHGR